MLEMLGLNGTSAVAAGTATAFGAALVVAGVILFGFAAALVVDVLLGAGYVGVKTARVRYLAKHPEHAAE